MLCWLLQVCYFCVNLILIYFSNTSDADDVYKSIQEIQEDANTTTTTTTNQIEKEEEVDLAFEFSSCFQPPDSVNSDNKSPGMNLMLM